MYGTGLLLGLARQVVRCVNAPYWLVIRGQTEDIHMYGTGLLLGLARQFGRSTYASWIAHVLLLGVTLFMGG